MLTYWQDKVCSISWQACLHRKLMAMPETKACHRTLFGKINLFCSCIFISFLSDVVETKHSTNLIEFPYSTTPYSEKMALIIFCQYQDLYGERTLKHCLKCFGPLISRVSFKYDYNTCPKYSCQIFPFYCPCGSTDEPQISSASEKRTRGPRERKIHCCWKACKIATQFNPTADWASSKETISNIYCIKISFGCCWKPSGQVLHCSTKSKGPLAEAAGNKFPSSLLCWQPTMGMSNYRMNICFEYPLWIVYFFMLHVILNSYPKLCILSLVDLIIHPEPVYREGDSNKNINTYRLRLSSYGQSFSVISGGEISQNPKSFPKVIYRTSSSTRQG